MTRLPWLHALAASFVRYCARVTARHLMDQLIDRQHSARDAPYGLADPWIGIGARSYLL